MEVNKILVRGGTGYRTLWYQDTSVSNHFGTSVFGPSGLTNSVPVPMCLRTLRHQYRNVSGHFGTGSEVSSTTFGTGIEMSTHYGLIGMKTI